jgi:hypothetical protein
MSIFIIRPITRGPDDGAIVAAQYYYEDNPRITPGMKNDPGILYRMQLPVSAYSNITNKNGEGWRITFDPVNKFLATLNDHDQAMLYLTLALVVSELQTALSQSESTNLMFTINKIATHLEQLDNTIQLVEKIEAFNFQQVPLTTDYDRAGRREQDSEKTTLYNRDVRDNITMALLCKLMCPIFGCVFAETRKLKLPINPEAYNLALVSKLLTRRLNHTMSKLEGYISHTMMKAIGNNRKAREENAQLIMYNSSSESVMTEKLLATWLSRNLVNIDLFDPFGDIPKCLFTVIKQAATGALGDMRRESQVTPRGLISSGDDNRSQLELDTSPTREKISIRAIVSTNVDPAIARIIKLAHLETAAVRDHITSAGRFTPVTPPNQFNQAIIPVLFGEDLGGGAGLFLLDNVMLSRLALVTQWLAFKLGYTTVAHLLTATSTNQAKGLPTQDDYMVRNNYTTTSAYQKLNEMFGAMRQGGPVKAFPAIAQTLVGDLVDFYHVYNTSPYLWKQMNEENRNGQTIQLPVDAAQQLWGFIYDAKVLGGTV